MSGRSTACLYAMYHLGAYYHSGQWSRGYRMLCRVQRALKKRGIREPQPYWFLPPEFRSEMAHYLWRWRHLRRSL